MWIPPLGDWWRAATRRGGCKPKQGRDLSKYSRKRTKPITEIVIHESVTRRSEPEDGLARRKLSVHEVVH